MHSSSTAICTSSSPEPYTSGILHDKPLRKDVGFDASLGAAVVQLQDLKLEVLGAAGE